MIRGEELKESRAGPPGQNHRGHVPEPLGNEERRPIVSPVLIPEGYDPDPSHLGHDAYSLSISNFRKWVAQEMHGS